MDSWNRPVKPRTAGRAASGNRYKINCIYTINLRLIVYTKNVLADRWPRMMAYYVGLFKNDVVGHKSYEI